MLRALRNKSQSFLFKIFLVLIVIGFAAWGVGDLTGNKIPPIFKSNDFEISYEQIINDFHDKLNREAELKKKARNRYDKRRKQQLELERRKRLYGEWNNFY